MSEIDSFLDGGVPAAPHSDIDSFLGGETKPQGKGVLGHVRDIGVSAAKSVVGVPEALVGLADIPTGGAVGKALENEDGSFGVRFKETQDILSDLYTDEYKEQQRQFSETDGVLDKASVALQNPSLITNTVVQSVGPMLAGGAIGKGAGLVAKSSPVVAGAIGEGAIMAGSQAEGIRQQTEDGLLTAGQSAAAAATGVMGGLFGYAGGRLAQKLGIGDVDTMLAGGVKPQQVADDLAQTPAKSVPRQVIEGAISEGFLEELPQSVSEQIVQNLALGKDWSEGVEDSAVMGTLAGMAMGGVGAGFAGVTQPKQEQVQPQPTPENPTPAPVQRPNPNAGPLSAAANLLPAPESDGTLYGDAAGNVSGNRPSWVNPENDPDRQSFGPGMDQQAVGGVPGFRDKPLEGELQNLAGAGVPLTAAASKRQPQTFENDPPRLTDGRQQGVIVDADGNAQLGKLPNNPPADYVQGGRGMDQQAPVGKRFGNELAARNAVAKAAQPDALEVVSVGPKEFEVRAKAPVLQNRDRSTPASITQMREIAARPDYSRLGFSRDFANGAPVVEPGANVSAQQLGRQDVATTGSGRKIPVQYAVVEAASLMPSHDANGTPDQHYATGMKSKSRAIAGNGRVAGLRQAFAQGTATEYVEQLAGDASLHGISPATIRSMKEPVLVRIMPREEITQDIGDESNTTGVSALSGAEQAMNDARRINIDDMEFSASGEISETTVRQFVQSMPKAEQGGLLDGSRPSRQAYDRAENAIFANAYESESLIRLQAQATDPEVRTVLSGLLMAAPKMARLKGAGAWDIRGLVVEAAEAAVNARRNGQTLEQFAQQIDLDRNPESQFFIELFASNIRSAKRIGDELSAVAELFYAEASKAEIDMFGAVPRRSRQELLQELLNGAPDADATRTPANAQTAGNQAGPGTAAADGQARDAERAEPAGAAAAAPAEPAGQEFQLESYDEQQLAEQSRQKAEADAKAAAEAKAAADKAQADRDRNDFTLTGSDRPSDVAAARGQNDMFAPPTRGEKKAQQEQAANNAPEADRPASTSERQPIRFVSGQPASEYLADGSTIEDGDGQQYRVHYQRNDLVVAHPIIDGKAQVNSESGVRFHVGRPESADGRRTDPIYLVQDKRQQAQGVADQLASMNLDDLSALIDEISEQEAAPQTAKPKAQRSSKAKTASGKPRVRSTTSKAERTDTAKPDDVSRSAGEIAKSLGVNMSSAGMNALEGLTKLFGGPGRLNSGLSFDEETYAKAKPFFAAAMRDIQAAGKDLRDFIRALVGQFGDGVKPYILRYAQDIKREQDNGRAGINLESDRTENAEQGTGADIRADRSGADGRSVEQLGQGQGGQRADAAAGLRGTGAAAGGEHGNQSLDGAQSAVAGGDAGSADAGRGRPSSTGGLYAGRTADPAADRATAQPVAAPAKANLQPSSKPGTPAEIKAQMPFLTEGQADDVVFAEKRLSKPDGYGVLFTNGTGTGKTFTGLGIAARAHANGKTNILVVAPKQTIVDSWVKAARGFFGLEVKPLASTRDHGGSGIVATTYANLGANAALAQRDWDMVINDESHYLSSAEDGSSTAALETLRALTKRRGYARNLVRLRESEKVERLQSLTKEIDQADKELAESGGNANFSLKQLERDRNERDALNAELNALYEKEEAAFNALKPEDKPRGVFLSATPFAYEKNVAWAQQFLFDWGSNDANESQAYNSGGRFERFMMQHFGYRMRYNKLTEPDAKVDRGLMQRAFNTWLKREGALSGRALDSAYDYDRKFVTLEAPIGRRVDDALKWLRNHASGRDMQGNELNMSAAVQTAYRDLQEKITGENFNYHARMYFLEAIKAREALPHIRAQLAKGRKVVVMHDFKQGGVTNPFIIGRTPDNQALNDAIAAFSAEFADLQQAFSRLPSPIQQLTRAFPDALVYNGDYSAKQRLAMQNAFNDDSDDAPRLIIAQGDAMREGVSIHDTTGKFPRVLVHLGMPVKPTAAIQQEGRIYRTGQASHAMFRYFTIGTAWERSAFAGKIAKRAGAAENLAMGEQARGLKQAFIDAYEDADLYEPGFAGEGQGGKARDQALATLLTPWDMAKSFYFGSKTQGKGRSSRGREGADYFATPEPVGLKMVEWADIRAGESVLEPSAGHGAIARWFPDGAKVRVIEQSGELASRVALHVDGDVVHGSFEDHHIVNKYDAIVMNPPYGLGGAVAIPHLAKAAEHLRDGGRVVALIPTGPAADKKFDNWLYALDKNGKSQHPDLHLIADVTMPSVTFERAGTSAATRLVIIERVTGEQAEQLRPTRKADLTSIESIGELFDRLENMEMPARLKPVEEEAEQTAPAKSVKPAKLSYAEQAAAQVDKLVTDAPIIEHTTGKGKVLKGVIVTDMSLDEVREKLDKYAFRKNGGVFVRQEYIARPDGGAALFSRRPVNVAGAARPVLEHDAVKAIVERVNARLGLPLKLQTYRSEAALFAASPEIVGQAEHDGAKGQINAAYHDGVIHVVTSAFAREADVELAILDAMAHEGQGHYGIRALFGGDRKFIDSALREFFASIGGLTGVRRVAAKHGIDMSLYFETAAKKDPIAAAAYLADELLAHLQGKAATASLSARAKAAIQAYLGAIREWLRNHGFTNLAKGTDADIALLLKRMRDASRLTPGDSKGAPRFSLRPLQTSGEAFKRWFGKSKVVDKDGQPLNLYHGTAADFTVFDQARAGSATGHATSALGIFMSSDRRAAQSYAEKASDGMPGYGRVMDLYASIQNPYLMSVEESQEVENPLQARRLRTRLEQQGYDGIRLKGTPVWIAFNNYQVKSATDNTGAFDEFDPDIRFSRSSDDATREALDGLGLAGKDRDSLLQQIRDLGKEGLKAKLADWAQRSREGLFDGLEGIRRAEEAVGITDPNQQGYVSARQAAGTADVLHAILLYGAPVWKDGIIDYKEGSRGLLEVLADLGQNNLQNWLGWLGGKRAELLKAQGRENNLSDQEIAELIALGKGKEALFEKVYQEYAALNEAILDLAEGAGIIDPKARAKWQTEYYVPFYREPVGEDAHSGPSTKRGLSHQSAAIRALKGGKLPTKDLLSNIMQGMAKRVDASMKNYALLEIVDNLKDSHYLSDESPRYQQVLISRSQIAQQVKKDRKALKLLATMLGLPESANFLKVANELMKPQNEGFEKLWTRVAPTDPDIIRVMRDGKPEYYRVNDESLLRGVLHMAGPIFNDPVTSLGRTFKRMLTTGVTASPEFILRNYIRDSVHNWMINPDGFKFGIDSIKGLQQAFAEDADFRAMMFHGSSFAGGYIHATDPEASAQMIRRALRQKGITGARADGFAGSIVNTKAKAAEVIKKGWEQYREWGDKVENANRLGVYKAALAAGKSKRQAAYEARDVMDFAMRGNFTAAIWLTDVVPFLNARMQGLYKLGRAMKGDKTLLAKHVAIKGGYVLLFSLLLAAANDDDERYQELPNWDKDLYWHIFLGDEHFRIPKPFELGLLFGTVPERMLHAATGTQSGSDLGRAVAHGVLDTLAFNPLPQVVKPMIEVVANRDFFRDSPIEGMADEGKVAEARYDERTSDIGYGIGQVTGRLFNLSPKQVDHLIKGYTGTLGAYTLGVADLIANAVSEGEGPDWHAGDIPLVRSLYQGDSVRPTQYQTDFYDALREADQLYRTVRAYREEGRLEEAKELQADSLDKLRHRQALGFARQQLGRVRNEMESVRRDKDLSGEVKQQRLDDLQRRSNAIAERIAKRVKEDF